MCKSVQGVESSWLRWGHFYLRACATAYTKRSLLVVELTGVRVIPCVNLYRTMYIETTTENLEANLANAWVGCSAPSY